MTLLQTDVARANVLDYGARADGITDDSAAFAQAIAAAMRADAVGRTVFVPAGRYCLKTPMGSGMIEIDGAENLTLEGETGTFLVSNDPTKHMVHVLNSRHIIVRRFEMDRNPMVFTQGRIDVIDVPGSAVEVVIDAGYDEPDAAYLLPLRSLHVWTDPGSHAWDQSEWGPSIVTRERIAPMRWRFTLNKPPRLDYLDKPFLIWDNVYKGWGVVCTSSADILVEDIGYYAGGADAGIGVWNCLGDVTYRRFTTGIPPGSNRRFAAAGGSQQFNNRGTVTMDDCDISRVDDDGANMGTIFCRVLGQMNSQTLLIENTTEPFGVGVPFGVGDTIALWDWNLKNERAVAKITELTREDSHSVCMALDREVQALRPVGSLGLPSRSDWDGKGRFEQYDGIDRVACFEAAGTLIIRNCRFQNLRARNILLKTSNSMIENNTFYDTNMASILVGPEFYWGEAPAVRNLTIRNNRFLNISGSSIEVGCFSSDHSYDNQNIVIEGNTFENYGQLRTINQAGYQGTAVRIRNADGVTIRNNTFGPAAPAVSSDAKPVVIECSRNVTIYDNIGVLDAVIESC